MLYCNCVWRHACPLQTTAATFKTSFIRRTSQLNVNLRIRRLTGAVTPRIRPKVRHKAGSSSLEQQGLPTGEEMSDT